MKAPDAGRLKALEIGSAKQERRPANSRRDNDSIREALPRM